MAWSAEAHLAAKGRHRDAELPCLPEVYSHCCGAQHLPNRLARRGCMWEHERLTLNGSLRYLASANVERQHHVSESHADESVSIYSVTA